MADIKYNYIVILVLVFGVLFMLTQTQQKDTMIVTDYDINGNIISQQEVGYGSSVQTQAIVSQGESIELPVAPSGTTKRTITFNIKNTGNVAIDFDFSKVEINATYTQ